MKSGPEMGQESTGIIRGERRRWLCIAYAFPPMLRSGTHRTLAFVRHLDRLGWDATVLTVEPGDEPSDPTLLDLVPTSTEIVRTPWIDSIARIKCAFPFLKRREAGAGRASCEPHHGRIHVSQNCKEGTPRSIGIRDWVSQWLMTPDSRVGWIPAALRAARRIVHLDRPDVIYSTSPYASAHLIAMGIARRADIPWVADFRDPWGGNPFQAQRSAAAQTWDSYLERQVLRHASQIICNTSTQRSLLLNRFPRIANKCSVILNGIDDEPINVEPIRIVPTGVFLLTHAGQFYGRRRPEPWLRALAIAKHRHGSTASRIHFAFLGGTTCDGCRLAEIAASHGVADQVHVLGSKNHKDAFRILAGSDAVILAGAGGPGANLQVPNKLFEYLSLHRPILATVSPGNPAVDILRDARADAMVCPPDDPDAIADALSKLVTRSSPSANADWSGVDQFHRTHRAAELESVFQRVNGGVEQLVAVAAPSTLAPALG